MHRSRVLGVATRLGPLFIAGAVWAGPPAPSTSVSVQAPVPLAQDSCLDHTVKELGMSAKKADSPARHWDIAPKFLHGALAKDVAASVSVELEKTDKATLIHVRAAWSGAPKDKDVQLEIEERLRLMTTKMAQQCNVVRPELVCTTTPAGGVAAPCVMPPPAQ